MTAKKSITNIQELPQFSNAKPAADIQRACDQWVAAIGAKNVMRDDETIARYARSTANFVAPPTAVLRPSTTAEVQEIVRIANSCHVPLHAISAGKNWGYGDACATSPGQVIVDLCDLNRILEVDAELGYIKIEAGVTQGQLHDFLNEHKLPLWMDATAAGPTASIVGNTLDRGFGHTRYGDRSLYNCGMTIVLPNGELLKTGFSHYENAKAHGAYRNGVGPSVDGLFFQSNLGIVTEMGLWLMPKPEAFSAFFFTAQSEDDLTEIINRLAPLKRQGLLPSAIHIANDLRLISNRAKYPWERTGGVTPLPRQTREEIRRRYQVDAWVGCGALYGTKEVVRALEKTVRSELRHFKPVFLDASRFQRAEKFVRFLEKFGLGKELRQKVESARPVLELIQGIPSGGAVHSCEWRVKNMTPQDATAKPHQDPLDSNAGLIWISPVLPMTSSAASEVLHILDTGFKKHGFDTLVTFTMITDRALCCVSNIAYDRRDEVEVARAKACYNELYENLIKGGYIPYRSGPSGFAKLSEHPSSFWDFTHQLKEALDPNEILSPGRYIPRSRAR